jgi:hypothetical protein
MINERKGQRRLLFLAVLVLVAASVIGTGVIRRERKPQQQIEPVSTLPAIFSKVKKLEIVSARIVRPNTDAASVEVEIRNNSDRAVMAVDVVCGQAGVTKNGLTDEARPIVVIEPGGTTVVEMGFREMTPGAPLVVSAAIYADGKEEGEAASLESMHRVRDHDKAQRQAERKGGTTP